MPDPDTLLPFAPDEAAAIRRMLGAENATVVCPRCKGALTLNTSAAADGSTVVWELKCGLCRRHLVVRDRGK